MRIGVDTCARGVTSTTTRRHRCIPRRAQAMSRGMRYRTATRPLSMPKADRRARHPRRGATERSPQLDGCTARVTMSYFTSGGTEALNIVLTPDLTVDDGRSFGTAVGRGRRASRGLRAAIASARRSRLDRCSGPARSPRSRLPFADCARSACWEPASCSRSKRRTTRPGSIQPVREAADLVHAAGGFVVCDSGPGGRKDRLSISQTLRCRRLGDLRSQIRRPEGGRRSLFFEFDAITTLSVRRRARWWSGARAAGAAPRTSVGIAGHGCGL